MEILKGVGVAKKINLDTQTLKQHPQGMEEFETSENKHVHFASSAKTVDSWGMLSPTWKNWKNENLKLLPKFIVNMETLKAAALPPSTVKRGSRFRKFPQKSGVLTGRGVPFPEISGASLILRHAKLPRLLATFGSDVKELPRPRQSHRSKAIKGRLSWHQEFTLVLMSFSLSESQYILCGSIFPSSDANICLQWRNHFLSPNWTENSPIPWPYWINTAPWPLLSVAFLGLLLSPSAFS